MVKRVGFIIIDRDLFNQKVAEATKHAEENTMCMCGADDCKSCHPENFHRGAYMDPYAEEPLDMEQIEARLDEQADYRYQLQKDMEHDRYDWPTIN